MIFIQNQCFYWSGNMITKVIVLLQILKGRLKFIIEFSDEKTVKFLYFVYWADFDVNEWMHYTANRKKNSNIELYPVV